MRERRVRRTVSLPPCLSEEIDRTIAERGGTASSVVQDALVLARREDRRRELAHVRDHWAREAAMRGVLTEEELAMLVRIVDAPRRDDVFGWED